MRGKRLIIVASVSVGVLSALDLAWHRNRRIGSGIVNRIINPRMLDRGLAGSGRSELGVLEHVGRRSGIRRLTPVHPERTTTGFRIIAPLAEQSEWARNVLAAGHCRLQLRDVVYDLDEPALVGASEVVDLPTPLRSAMRALGFDYLVLHEVAAAAGSLTAQADVPAGESEESHGKRQTSLASGEVSSAA